MRFIATVVILAGTLPTLANAQAQVNQRVHFDVTGGLAVPTSRDLQGSVGFGADLLIGVSYPLSRFVDWRLDAGATLFLDAGPDALFQSSSGSTWADPLLSVLTGARIALSPASTHMYLQGSVGAFAQPGDFGTRSGPAVGIGTGIRTPRVFGEIAYTYGFEGDRDDNIAYVSFRCGVSLGSR
jgi:hypothetical protein